MKKMFSCIMAAMMMFAGLNIGTVKTSKVPISRKKGLVNEWKGLNNHE